MIQAQFGMAEDNDEVFHSADTEQVRPEVHNERT